MCEIETRVDIRWMIRRDMPRVLEIEHESYGTPWQEEDFLKCLRQRNCIGMVAENGDHIHGFMIYELQKKRLELRNIAVEQKSRRQGVARQMIEKLQFKLENQKRDAIVAHVWETNLRAQLFFRSMGFKAVEVLEIECEDGDRTAYRMEYRR